jgi:ribosome maturation factor RimP
MSALVRQLEKLLEEALSEYTDLFYIKTESNPEQTRFRFLIDGDEGVSIEKCARISRYISKAVDEHELGGEKKFVFEVSSPGAENAIELPRQYPKHIGRQFELTLENEENPLTVKLLSVGDASIKVVPLVKNKHKWKELPEMEVAFSNILKSKIILSFK